MFQIISRLVCDLIADPTLATQAIKSNELQKLEVWLMYWAVMGTIMALESTVEWIFAWFPFYYEFKTIVILWLTLPQIQGSTYIYVAHVHPFLASHEEDIDAAIADAKVRAKAAGIEWLNKAVQRLRQAVIGTLAPQLLDEAPNPEPPAQMIRHPPTFNDPASGATAQLYNIAGNVIRTYGPAAVAAGTALLHPMNGRMPQPVRVPPGPPARDDGMRGLGAGNGERPRTASFPSSYYSGNERSQAESSGRASLTKTQARLRRAELEAQIAEIESGQSPSSSSSSSSASSTPPPGMSFHPRSVSAGPYVGSGTDSAYIPRDPVAARIDRSFVGGYGFEEIGRDELGDYPPIHAAAMDPGSTSPGEAKRGSWWWWGQQAGQSGYAPIVSEEKKDV
ncbi:hypothetical protein P7C70_g3203, partial [Phenoliferia sp. Uapishka_3]